MKLFHKNILAWCISIFTSLVLLEIGAKLVFGYLENSKTLGLDRYEIRDPKHPSNWVLNPGYTGTLSQLIEEKDKNGNVLAVKYLKERGEALRSPSDDIIMKVNQDGFKGPELRDSKLKILAIGDSCTFGSHFDKYAYPRKLERLLLKQGFDVEVINGGVEGYSPRNVLFRIDEFLKLRPQIVTIYLGWNALFVGDENAPFYTIKLMQVTLSKLFPKQTAIYAYQKAKKPDKDAKEVDALNDFKPHFMDDLEEIIQKFTTNGSHVVLLTLPCLFDMETFPTKKAMVNGHLPTFTNNPFVLAKLSEEYNQRLREISALKEISLIDLELWGKEALVPKDKYFFDSVHLYEEGQEMIGAFLAEKLIPLIERKKI